MIVNFAFIQNLTSITIATWVIVIFAVLIWPVCLGGRRLYHILVVGLIVRILFSLSILTPASSVLLLGFHWISRVSSFNDWFDRMELVKIGAICFCLLKDRCFLNILKLFNPWSKYLLSFTVVFVLPYMIFKGNFFLFIFRRDDMAWLYRMLELKHFSLLIFLISVLLNFYF